MTDSTVRTIAAGIADRLDTIPGLQAYGYVPESIRAPMAEVTIQEVEYAHAFNAATTVRYEFIVTVYISRSAQVDGQWELFAYLSPDGAESVRAAIHGDRTLNSVVDDASVGEATRISSVQQGDGHYLAVDFTVEVITT